MHGPIGIDGVNAGEELLGRTALVTGGSSDIGAAIVRALAKRGADVAIHYHRNADRAPDPGTVRAADAIAVTGGDVGAQRGAGWRPDRRAHAEPDHGADGLAHAGSDRAPDHGTDVHPGVDRQGEAAMPGHRGRSAGAAQDTGPVTTVRPGPGTPHRPASAVEAPLRRPVPCA